MLVPLLLLIITLLTVAVLVTGVLLRRSRRVSMLRAGSELDFAEQVGASAVRLLQHHRVILSCTTSPLRLPKLHNVLSQLDLTLVHRVVVALPEKYMNRQAYPDELPLWMQDSTLVEIVRVPHDPGPICKLVPALQRYPNDVIVTVDDDIQHSPNLIVELVKVMGAHRDEATGEYPIAAGRASFDNYWGFDARVWPRVDTPVRLPSCSVFQVAEGFGGVAYPAWRLDPEEMLRYSALSKATRMSDDLVISYHAALQQVPVVGMQALEVRPYQYGLQGDALHNQDDMHERYKQALRDMQLEDEHLLFSSSLYDAMPLWNRVLPWVAGHRPDPLAADDSVVATPQQITWRHGHSRVHYVMTTHLRAWVRQVLPTLRAPIVLVTGRSDTGCPAGALKKRRLVAKLCESPMIHRMFIQNLDLLHPKATPVPIGVDLHSLSTKSMWGMPRESVPAQLLSFQTAFQIARRTPLHAREFKVVACFTPIPLTRAFVKSSIPHHLLLDLQQVPRYQLISEYYARCAFVLSPVGNGWDCHRTWEALLAGNIVLVQHGPAVDAGLFEGLPVIPVRDWTTVTEAKLLQWFEEWKEKPVDQSKLTAKYWCDRVRRAADQLPA